MEFHENRDTYTKIASLYYLANMQQDEIAVLFGVSRYKISRIIKKCRTMKIVEFRINNHPEYYRKMETQISGLLGIERAIITPGGSTLQDSKENVARIASQYLEKRINDGMKIGLSWGSTIQQIARYFDAKATYPKITFVQLSGNICTRSMISEGYVDGSAFVRQMAEKARAGWAVFNLPYIMQNPTLKELLYQEPHIMKHISLFKELDMAIIGVGSADPAKSVSYLSGYLTYEEAKKLAEDGMSADICGTRLTPDGKVSVNGLTNRVITIDLEDIKNLRDVCAVAAGSEKSHSIIAGCKGGYIKSVIIDEICALAIINALS